MSNIDLFEIEHKVHHWVTQLSVAAAQQNWGVAKHGGQHYGLSSHLKVSLAKYVSGSILDESDAISIQTKLSVWEQVFAQFSATVTQRDFPHGSMQDDNGNQTLDAERMWGYLHQLYGEEFHIRHQISADINAGMQMDRKLKM